MKRLVSNLLVYTSLAACAALACAWVRSVHRWETIDWDVAGAVQFQVDWSNGEIGFGWLRSSKPTHPQNRLSCFSRRIASFGRPTYGSAWRRIGFSGSWYPPGALLPSDFGLDSPIWLPLVLTALPSVWRLWRLLRRLRPGRWRYRQGRCPRCGYDLRASGGRCPECGRTIPTPLASSPGLRPSAAGVSPAGADGGDASCGSGTGGARHARRRGPRLASLGCLASMLAAVALAGAWVRGRFASDFIFFFSEATHGHQVFLGDGRIEVAHYPIHAPGQPGELKLLWQSYPPGTSPEEFDESNEYLAWAKSARPGERPLRSPLWLATGAAVALAALLLAVRAWLGRPPRGSRRCAGCGHPLRFGAGRCPGCGRTASPPQAGAVRDRGICWPEAPP